MIDPRPYFEQMTIALDDLMAELDVLADPEFDHELESLSRELESLSRELEFEQLELPYEEFV